MSLSQPSQQPKSNTQVINHILDELMNIAFGNSRYVRYRRRDHMLFMLTLGLLLFLPFLVLCLS